MRFTVVHISDSIGTADADADADADEMDGCKILSLVDLGRSFG